jgi:hypothetical protein
MKKAAILFIALVILATPGVVRAAPSNNPVFATLAQVEQSISSATAAIQAQVNALAERVATLESITPGAKFVLVDSSNQKLGTLVDGFALSEQKTVFNEEYGRFVTFHPSTGQVTPTSNLFYESNNCTGNAYVQGPWLNNYVFRVGNTTNKLAMVQSTTPATVTTHSYSDGDTCAIVSDTVGNAYQAVIVQPYSEPVNPLFHIEHE